MDALAWILTIVAGITALVRNAAASNRTRELIASRKELVGVQSQLAASTQQLSQTQGKLVDTLSKLADAQTRNATLQKSVEQLAPFSAIVDATAEAAKVREQASADAGQILAQAKTQADKAEARAALLVEDAQRRCASLVSSAELEAQRVAGDALRALKEADALKAVVAAMKNAIDGYGDRYLVPTQTLLDNWADSYSFDQAGRDLKAAREATRSLLKAGKAATCDYVEANRKATAVAFVIDAFNGKVDSITATVKDDNFGTLEQKLRDAFNLVNHLGSAFRDARITPEYFAARLDELRYACAVVALREREREEQRQIREQIREEEKARREIERALKDAQREEDLLQKALKKAQEQVARANDETRAALELKLAELQTKLAEAEAKNQRAISMAQQTKAGHVYVISNIGAFGDNVFKVGMTRRLEPLERIRELGDASVPFSFDVHALLWSDDAPALEHALHKHFVAAQVNKVNPRKEFFRAPINDIKAVVERLGLTASWTLAAHAAEYRETLAIEEAIRNRSPEAKVWLEAQLAVPEPAVAQDTDANETQGIVA